MSAPACARCRDDEHEKCGGPELGCGCAANNHYEKTVEQQIQEHEEIKKAVMASIREGVRAGIAKWPGGAIQTLEELIMAEMPIGLGRPLKEN